MVISLYAFLCRAYNLNDEEYEDLKVRMRMMDRRLNFARLHVIFYREFMVGLCRK